MQEICSVCGRTAKRFYDSKCGECYGLELKLPKVIELTTCKRCGRFKKANHWSTFESAIRNKIKLRKQFSVERNKEGFEVLVEGYVHNGRLKIFVILCEDCSRMSGGYYETKLQLRGIYNSDIIDIIEKNLNEMSRHNRLAFFRVKHLKEGIDYYIGSKSSAENVARILKKRRFKIIRSFKLHTRRGDKNIYRETISARK